MVQQDADALGLGVEVEGFTVGGMHPPVRVAADYQAVVSAELGKVTAVVNAQAIRNRTVPYAESFRPDGREHRPRGGRRRAGPGGGRGLELSHAWSRSIAARPEEYFFRRRLETLEKGLSGRRFTVVDSRFQRDGGELWVIP